MQRNPARAGADRMRIRLAPRLDAPAAARRALRELALGEHADDVLLLASELVTSAVTQARSEAPIELDADCDEDRIRVELCDPERFIPGDGGYALRILSLAASRWGIEQDRATRVWFELPLH
jgi:hypothetical protein